MPEFLLRVIMVILLCVAAWACFEFAPHFLGAGLPGEFPVILPLVLVFAILTLASRAHEMWKHRD